MRSLLVLTALVPCLAQAPPQPLAREICKQLIEIDTTDSSGDNTKAAEAMAARLKAAGFPESDVQVLSPAPRKGNLVARLRGTGARKPILLLGHLDVVEARRADWSFNPFQFIERDGFFYGRGTQDIKSGDAALMALLIRFKREGFRPGRDLILALTADEETGDFNGANWLLKNHRDLVDAEYCLNVDAGGGLIKNGRPLYNGIETSEKVFLSFYLEVHNPGGHSSLPRKDNAIYRLAAGLMRLAHFAFPEQLNETTHLYFERMAAILGGQTGADMRAILQTPPDPAALDRLSNIPEYNSRLRTTCVATMLEAGHAENALPQRARATVNCRLLPGTSPEEVQQTLERVVADPQIAITQIKPAKPSPPSPLRPDIFRAIEKASDAVWPSAPVIPVMTAGATDGLYFRKAGIPTYGVSGLFIDIGDDRAHGKDERIRITSFDEAADFLYRLVKSLSS